MNESIITVAISASIALLTLIYTYWNNRVQNQNNRIKVFEDINVELIKQRIEVYTVFMTELIIISSVEAKNLSSEPLREKAKALIQLIQKNIFSKIGLLASHEAREIILRLRSKCISFLEGKISFAEVHTAAMGVHQILRSDLGVAQPGLSNNIEKLRAGEIAGKGEQIERIINGMNHIKW